MTKPPRSTFFSIAITITLVMLVFTLVANFVAGLGVFDEVTGMGTETSNTGGVLQSITGLSDPNMNSIFIGVTGITFLGAVGLCYLTKNITPIGLHLFGTIFWTSWLRLSVILSYGGYVDVELISIFTIGVMFVFIGAIIGMLTGSG